MQAGVWPLAEGGNTQMSLHNTPLLGTQQIRTEQQHAAGSGVMSHLVVLLRFRISRLQAALRSRLIDMVTRRSAAGIVS